MRFPALPLLFFAAVTTVSAQAPQTNRAVGGRTGAASSPAAQQPDQKSADANGVDTIISLVKANMSEALVLKTIQRQNKVYDLTPEDLVKLQKAGVSETIINAMLDPTAASAANSIPSAAPASAAAPSAAPVAPAESRPASTPAAPATASKGASASNTPAAGCPQQPSTAAPAPAQQQTKGGVFSSFKDKLKGSAQKTVDGLGDTVNCAVDNGVESSQTKVSSAVDNAVGAPAQKVADVDSTANKTAPANNTSSTGNATAAQAGAKKSSQK